MVQLKSLAFAFAFAACFLLGAQAGPCNTCSPVNIIKDSSFESNTTPWHFGDGTQIGRNTPPAEFAHSGEQYATFDVAQRYDTATYSIFQQLSDLKPNKPYSLTYFYAETANTGIYDGGLFITVSLDGVQIDQNNIFSRQQLDFWFEHSLVITPWLENQILTITVGGTGDYFYGASLIMDDITMGRACVLIN